MSDPGWYPDPDDASRARYWDGSAWTDRFRSLSGDAEKTTAGRGRSRVFLWVALVAVVAVAAGVFVLAGGDSASADEVVLESATAAGEDPFFESIAKSAVAVEGGGVELAGTGGAAVASLAGDTPGLYGGTGEDACDPAALVAFLEGNATKAAAFAEVLGIAPDGIADYVATLTPVVLREDTRVTNHGFSDGKATPRQSVLQAGTAVLVDDRGVPRVKCSCGNPLTEPAPTEGTPAFQGDAWPAFDENRLLAVTPADEALTELQLVDLTTGQAFIVSVGAGARPVTKELLLNATLPLTCQSGEPVTLVDGMFERGEYESEDYCVFYVESPNEYNAESLVDVVIGDVTGDGVDDGVVLVLEVVGNTQANIHPLLFSDGRFLAKVPIGEIYDTNTFRTLRLLAGGVIEVGGIEYIYGCGGDCNTTAPVAVRSRWDGQQLVVVP